MRGSFGPNGALYDGWETRRHNPTYDWVIIKLGPKASHLNYCDIDTAWFKGNECPQSRVYGLLLSDKEFADPKLKVKATDERWEELLSTVTLGPDSRHIFKLNDRAQEGQWNCLKVLMIPDGGMGRFRAYGRPLPPKPLPSFPSADVEPINLLSPLIGGHVVTCSDANFSPPVNLLRSGRGIDMSDGWETRRSQIGRGKYAPGAPLEGQERKEWVIGKLGSSGNIQYVEVDTAFHPGNYPVATQIEATYHDGEEVPADAKWDVVVKKTPCGSHRQHWLAVERGLETNIYSHIRCSIYPDGGFKRLRIYGHPLAAGTKAAAPGPVIALPLTYEQFKPYGSVIQGFSLPTSSPKGIPVTTANQGTASKFHRLSVLPENEATISVQKTDNKKVAGSTKVPTLQKASAAFSVIPLPTSDISSYNILVAQSGSDGKPDASTIKAFVATVGQGVTFAEGTWYAPLNCGDFVSVGPSAGAQAGETVQANVDVYVPEYPQAAAEDALKVPTQTAQLNGHVANGVANGAAGKPIRPVPITEKNWAKYGSLIAPGAQPAEMTSSYPAGKDAKTAIGVFRATPKVGLVRGQSFDIKLLERHPHTSQAFVPMGKGALAEKGEEALAPGGVFLAVVAQAGSDGNPDPNTVEAFLVPPGQGLVYNQGVWHHPVLMLDATVDLACIETQICNGKDEADPSDCELLEFSQPIAVVDVPAQ